VLWDTPLWQRHMKVCWEGACIRLLLFLALKFPCSAEQAAQITTQLLSIHFPLLQSVYPYTLVGLFRFRLFILPRHHLPPGMCHDVTNVQKIFCVTPHHKQVMMFSATLALPPSQLPSDLGEEHLPVDMRWSQYQCRHPHCRPRPTNKLLTLFQRKSRL
jgi:hypothetical protein